VSLLGEGKVVILRDILTAVATLAVQCFSVRQLFRRSQLTYLAAAAAASSRCLGVDEDPEIPPHVVD
jgi:hypothetical protein